MKRSAVVLALLVSAPWRARAQLAPAPLPQPVTAMPGGAAAQPSTIVQQPAYAYLPAYAPVSNRRSGTEITVLYTTSALYGVGLGVWLGAEAHIVDPGLFLIAPAILGVAGPVGVYLLDNPALPRGVPAAIASGLVIGAGEGIGIASYQFVSSSSEKAWGFRGLSRSTLLGATLGGAGGGALGYLQDPSPKSSLLTTSAVLWGAAIGTMFGYGASAAGEGYGRANDSAALGGLIGYNLGLAAAAGLSTVYIPTYRALTYMWAGAAIGALVSLPVYAAYAGKNSPPAKHGLVFSGVTTLLGIGAGALLAGTSPDSANSDSGSHFAELDYLLPLPTAHGAELAIGGRLE